MRYPLFCRGGCGRQQAWATFPPGCTVKTKYYGYCVECAPLIKWGVGMKDLDTTSHAKVTRRRYAFNFSAKVQEYKKDLLNRKIGKVLPG